MYGRRTRGTVRQMLMIRSMLKKLPTGAARSSSPTLRNQLSRKRKARMAARTRDDVSRPKPLHSVATS